MRLWLAVVIAAAALGCGSSDRTFRVEFAARQGVDALPVTVVDRTGAITLVEIAPGAPIGRGHMSSIPGRPNLLILSWIGGTCDHATELRFERRDDGYELSEHTDRADNCDLMGIPRAIALHLSLAITPESVTFLPNL